MTQFESWLTKKLQELKTDEGVFLPYIVGILEGDEESEEEKAEGITGLLADVLDDEAAIEKTLQEILVAWRRGSDSGQASVETVTAEVSKLDITQQMKLITQEKIATSKINKTEKTEEEKKIKAAILSGMAGGGGDSDDEGPPSTAGLVSNSNAEAVQKVGTQIIRLWRENDFIFTGKSRNEGKTEVSSSS